jgi:translation initiation factor 2 alpha subunit (eIF-2alpha)
MMLLESKTEEAIAKELGVSTRTVQRYKVILDKRYGSIWKQKTNDTLFLECNLFKNRMLKLYKLLEDEVVSPKTTAAQKVKCAEVAANIAIDILKLESEGIKAVKNGLVSIAAATAHKNALNNLRNDNDDDTINNNYHQEQEEQENDNRKF